MNTFIYDEYIYIWLFCYYAFLAFFKFIWYILTQRNLLPTNNIHMSTKLSQIQHKKSSLLWFETFYIL